MNEPLGLAKNSDRVDAGKHTGGWRRERAKATPVAALNPNQANVEAIK